MATVWTATHAGEHGFRRVVAIKLIRTELATDAAFRRMFLDEARLVSRLRHTNIVEILDLGDESSVLFHVMPFIDGDSLAGLVRRSSELGRDKLPLAVSVRILTDVLRGLHAAHELTDEHGVRLELVHRDVSPQNILVGRDGISKIGDFGIAKVLGRLSEETEVGLFKGKLAYAAPEQVQRKRIDRRTDIFAAGVVLWEMLTGRRLFKGEDTIDTVARLLTMTIEDPRKLVPGLPDAIAQVAMRALATSMDDRFPTSEAMADALEEAARELPRTASAKDVAALVEELVGSPEERKQRTSEAQPATQPATQATQDERSVRTVSGIPVPARATGSAQSRLRVAAVAAGVALLTGLTLVSLSSRWRHPDVPAAAATPAPKELAPPVPPSSALAPSSSLPSTAPALTQPATSSSGVTRRGPKRTAVPPRPSAPPLKFGNPYGR